MCYNLFFQIPQENQHVYSITLFGYRCTIHEGGSNAVADAVAVAVADTVADTVAVAVADTVADTVADAVAVAVSFGASGSGWGSGWRGLVLRIKGLVFDSCKESSWAIGCSCV
eukprot:1391582-Amorphochlora_amoeboformis.AAC.1